MTRYRPAVPDGVALKAALHHYQVRCSCGCGDIVYPDMCHREHDPALELRDYDPVTRKYTPDANDYRYITLMRSDCHAKKTHGPGGERRVTTKGSDNHTAKRLNKLSEKHARHIAAMAEKLTGTGHDRKGGEGKMAKKPAKKPAPKKATKARPPVRRGK